jgi:hypothetical protein
MKSKLSRKIRRKAQKNTSKMKVATKPSPTMKVVGKHTSALGVGTHFNNNVRVAPNKLVGSKDCEVLVVISILETNGGTNSKMSIRYLGSR